MERLLATVEGNDEALVYLRATPDGKLIVTGLSSSGGGTGDASAAKQDAQTALLTTIADVSKGTGVVDAKTQRVTLATDGPVVTAIGTIADAAATSDTGSSSLLALIKRGLQNWTTLWARLPALVSGRMPVDGSGVIQPVSLASVPLPNGAATESTLVQVRDSIKAQLQIASTVWTDNSSAYYVRRDVVSEGTGAITVAFTDVTGAAAVPGAGLKPLSTADRKVSEEAFDATAAGTGYAAGDVLARVLIVDTTTATPTVSAIWVNMMSGAVIAAPTAGTFERANESIGARQIGAWSVTVLGGSTSALQTTGNTSLSSLDTKLPSQLTPGLLPVDTLGTPAAPRIVATGPATANQALTATCRRISMYATQGTWYSISGAATATSHYIGTGERLDLDVPANTTMSFLQETTAGSVRITELV